MLLGCCQCEQVLVPTPSSSSASTIDQRSTAGGYRCGPCSVFPRLWIAEVRGFDQLFANAPCCTTNNGDVLMRPYNEVFGGVFDARWISDEYPPEQIGIFPPNITCDTVDNSVPNRRRASLSCAVVGGAINMVLTLNMTMMTGFGIQAAYVRYLYHGTLYAINRMSDFNCLGENTFGYWNSNVSCRTPKTLRIKPA